MDIIVDAYGLEEQAMGWYHYLKEKLSFPFRAKCITERKISPLREDDKQMANISIPGGKTAMNLDFLNPLNVAASAVKSLVDVCNTIKDRKDHETASMIADLTDLMEELRKTHSTIVKLVSPLRRIPDAPSTFSSDFKIVYNDFRDFYDAYDFGDERTHCHKIRQIQNRMLRRQPLFGSDQQWTELYVSLGALSDADLDLIDYQYKPFMAWFDQTMNGINTLVDNNDIIQAMAERRTFLAGLGHEYDKNKVLLEEMTDTIGKLTAGL